MCRLQACAVAASIALCMGCSRPSRSPDPATLQDAAAAHLQTVPVTDPKALPSRDLTNWQNPYLTILPEGIGLLDPADNEQRLLKPEEVLPALAHLPASAWPYGRVVALYEAMENRTEEQRVAIRRNKGIVAGTLEDAHVLIHWVPSS